MINKSTSLSNVNTMVFNEFDRLTSVCSATRNKLNEGTSQNTRKLLNIVLANDNSSNSERNPYLMLCYVNVMVETI